MSRWGQWERRTDLLDPEHTAAIESRVLELCVATGLARKALKVRRTFARCICARGLAFLSTVEDQGVVRVVIDAHPATLQVRP